MKTHPRHCKPGEQPCTQEHTYYCSTDGVEFIADESTFIRDRGGVLLPYTYWPCCSESCYRNTFSDDPNGAFIERDSPTANIR